MQYVAKAAPKEQVAQRTIPNDTAQQKPALNTQAKPFTAPTKPSGKKNNYLVLIALQFKF